MITSAEWYDPDPDMANFSQGDVVKDIPFFVFPTYSEKFKEEKWPVLRPKYLKAGRKFEDAMRQLPADLVAKAAKSIGDPPLWSYDLGEFIVSVARRTMVMIVTRSCAIDKPSTKHFLVAPVVTIGSLPAPERTEEKLQSLRNNDVFDWFYLPEKDDFPESFADLSHMLPVHWTFFGEPSMTNLVARLSSYGTSCLQNLLSDFYGTVFGFSYQDQCPQTGVYSCSKCFYMNKATITRKTVTASETFGECTNCGTGVTWVKMPKVE